MYKVLIVDDESLIIESLKVSIDWEKEGFQIIGCALNGLDALELIRESKPDIVFTDIRMPGISGIELIKKTSEINPDILFVIISGYAEFAYAQKAIKYNALGYCLKPFEEEEILSVLSKAKSIWDKGRYSESFAQHEIIDLFSSDNQQKVIDILKADGLSIDANREITVVASIGRGKLSMTKDTRYIQLGFDFNKRIYLLQAQDVKELQEHFAGQLSEDIVSIGLISGVKQMDALKNSIIEAVIAAYQFFIIGTKGVYTAKLSDTGALCKCLKVLEEASLQKDAIVVEDCFNTMKDLFGSGSLNIRGAFKVYNLITALLLRFQNEDDDAAIDDYEQLVSNYHNVYAMLENLKELTIKQCTVSNNDKLDGVDNAVVKQILDYINNNFYKAITVQQLSEKFFISPNYISFLFKKAVGENIKSYISRLRIAHACDLLENSKYSVQEVGEKVGYNDYFYFIRIFKSMKGISPSKYRDEFRENR